MKDQNYYLSGLIQIRVRASSAELAKERALQRVANLRSITLAIDLDRIHSDARSAPISLMDDTLFDFLDKEE